LSLTHTSFRAIRGKVVTSVPSPYISEFEAERINQVTSPFAHLAWKEEHRQEIESHLEEHRARTPVGKPLDFDKPKTLIMSGADLLSGSAGSARPIRIIRPPWRLRSPPPCRPGPS
jgi:hypothetical protein